MGVQTDRPTSDQLNDLIHLTTCITESLRLMPPIGQLINRLATSSLTLGEDHVVPEGTYVGYNSYATNCDPDVWGKDADEFIPGRWGETIEEVRKQYRRQKARAELIRFHGGRRACLGEGFAMVELKVTVFMLVRWVRWSLDEGWEEKMTPAGPLAPRGLMLVFAKR
ncbi:Cytochrome P450-DIT2 [Fulvia fulva]|nr:Cytochrome P450-DIT2 [Fulvia fulva]WPV14211.1 Cytochrome P450-DIT2 [Fulvia fulva]